MKRRLLSCLLGALLLASVNEAVAGDYDPRADPWISPEQRAALIAQQEAQKQAALEAERQARLRLEAEMQAQQAAEAERLRQWQAAEAARQAQWEAAEAERIRRMQVEDAQRLEAERRAFEAQQQAAWSAESESVVEAPVGTTVQLPGDAYLHDDAARTRMVREEARRAAARNRELSPYDNPLPTEPGGYNPVEPARPFDAGGGYGDPGTLPPPVERTLRRRTGVRLDLSVHYGWRDAPDGFLGTSATAAGAPALTRDGLDFSGAIGGSMTALIERSADTRIEFRGFYRGGFDDRVSDTGAFTWVSNPGGVTSTTAVQSATWDAESTVFGASLAWRPRLSESRSSRFDWILGIEANRIDDSLTLSGFAPGFGRGPNPQLRETLESWLLGVSGGIGFEANISRKMGFEASVRVFLGAGLHDVRAEQTDVFAPGTLSATRRPTDFVWGFDFDLGIRYGFSETVALRAGYTLLYRGEMPRIGEGLDLGNVSAGTPAVGLGSAGILVHGVFAGVSLDL